MASLQNFLSQSKFAVLKIEDNSDNENKPVKPKSTTTQKKKQKKTPQPIKLIPPTHYIPGSEGLFDTKTTKKKKKKHGQKVDHPENQAIAPIESHSLSDDEMDLKLAIELSKADANTNNEKAHSQDLDPLQAQLETVIKENSEHAETIRELKDEMMLLKIERDQSKNEYQKLLAKEALAGSKDLQAEMNDILQSKDELMEEMQRIASDNSKLRTQLHKSMEDCERLKKSKKN